MYIYIYIYIVSLSHSYLSCIVYAEANVLNLKF